MMTIPETTLATAEGKQESLLRTQIETLHATGLSLMPEGFERLIKPAEMQHLVAYLQAQRSSRKTFEGNQPQRAPVRDDDALSNTR